MLDKLKEVLGEIFGFITKDFNVLLLFILLGVVTGVWIAYCSVSTKWLKNHVNAVTLRNVEKFFRESNEPVALINILSERPNDIAMLFYMFARADMDVNCIRNHLTYKTYKKINNKRKPLSDLLFFSVSFVLFAVVTLAYGLNFSAISWTGTEFLFPVLGYVTFAVQFLVATIFFIVTNRKNNMYWREFKNLFGSMHLTAVKYLQKNEEALPEFNEKILEEFTPNKRCQYRIEKYVGKLLSDRHVKPKYNPSKRNDEIEEVHEVKEEKIQPSPALPARIEPVQPQTVKFELDRGHGGDGQSAQMMLQQMMHLMQQNMQHNQLMQQNMQQASILQYNQMMQPAVQQQMQQQMMQNAMFLQNMQSQMALQNMASRSVISSKSALPPLTMPEHKTITRDEPAKTDSPNSAISNTSTEEKPKEPIAELTVETTNTKPLGKEITMAPFQALNSYHERINKHLYENKDNHPIGPVVLLVPKRDPNKIETRLAEFFQAKVIKYESGEWEQLRREYSA